MTIMCGAMMAMLTYVACILDNVDNKKDDYHVWCYDGNAQLCGLHPGLRGKQER